MIRSFFSKKLFSLSAVLSVVLSTQLAMMPVVQASERSEQLNKYVKGDFLAKATRFLRDAESEGFRVLDGKGDRLSPERFLETSGTEFYLVSPETQTDPALSYRMRLHPTPGGLPTVTVTVTRPGQSRVLARRAFALDYKEDVTTLRMKMNETEQSLAVQIGAAIGERHASTWQKAGRVLQGLFGIPSAHAMKPLHAGVKAALGIAGVGVALYLATHVSEKVGLLNQKIGTALVIIGVVTAVALYYFSYGPENGVITPQPVPVGDEG